jgi:hypothetical protein
MEKQETISSCPTAMSKAFDTPLNMKLVKTISNYEQMPPQDKNTCPLVSVNGIKWNPCPAFNNQFVTVDDLSRLSVYRSGKDEPIVQETVTKGRLSCVAIEPRQGQHVLCGSIDTKLTLFNINRSAKRRET